MKNNEHKLVQDLFPSYIDGLTSEETNNLIEEHIEICEDCKKVLEQMKEKITEENHSQLDKKQIDYAKKYKRRLIFVVTVVTVSLIIFVWLIIDYYRKVLIFKKLEDLGNKYADCNNYTITKVTKDSFIPNVFPEKSQSVDQIYFKDGKELLVRSSIKYSSYNQDMFPIIYKEKIYFDSEKDKGYFLSYDIDGKIESAKYIDMIVQKISTYSNYFSEYSPFYMAYASKVSLEMLDGIYCYKIELKDGSVAYFEKNTGIVRMIYNEYYSYEFNNVSDDIVKAPEIPDNIKIENYNDN